MRARTFPRALGALGLVVAGVAPARAAPAQEPTTLIPGFTAVRSAGQHAIEERLLAIPDAARCEAAHRYLTAEPHVAGTPRDRELAEWVRDRWIEYGLEGVEIVEHEVLLSYGDHVSVEMVEPIRWRASLKEDPYPVDPDTYNPDVGVPYHGYSASGDTTAEVVYAHSGNPEDYDRLLEMGIDIRGKVALVRYSVPYSYRGFKVWTAQQRGAAGILIYSDPADDGYGKGPVYPEGPWGPESHIQRGAVVYDFLVPGDPLTPGWPSLPGARRIPREEARTLPSILSVPLSYKDAREILRRLEGPQAPESWQGGLPFPYRVGPGPARVRMRVQMDDRVRPIWTVVGRLWGDEVPERTVILGNHRDAWSFGGCDPSSGTATLMEVARTLGELKDLGMRPRRTIVLASWDAEEFTLTSSTEWGEQFAEELRRNAVAYLNVDASACGPELQVAAVPSLNQLMRSAAGAVADPGTGTSVLAAWRARAEAPDGLVDNRLGSGSDYTVFLNFLGVPIVDMVFDGPYGVYHSIYDNHFWISQFGDPGFRYHAAMARLWSVAAWRLADADLLPFDYAEYAATVQTFVEELRREAQAAGAPDVGLGAVAERAAAWRAAGERLNREASRALAASRTVGFAEANARLLQVERALLHPDGIPGRPWFRHVLYAPRYTYAPEILPGVREAVRDRDWARARSQAEILAGALRRAGQLTEEAARRLGN